MVFLLFKQPLKPIQVLYVGGAEIILNRYQVGVDVMEQSYLNDMGHWFVDAVTSDSGVQVRYMIPHNIPSEFPSTLEALAQTVLPQVQKEG